MSEIPRSPARRTARLVGAPLGFAGRAVGAVGRRALGRGEGSLSETLADEAAEQLFSVLGELKGGAMKVGQALSVFEAAMPDRYAEPFREVLVRLQSEAPPMDGPAVERVLDAQLGTAWRERFAEFDPVAVAAASIGQVHRAVWSDGRQVAVKVQYPGADEALRADLRQIRRLAPMLRPFNPGTDVRALIDELNRSCESELDYRNEADLQRRAHAAFAGVDGIAVPPVFASAPKVLVTGWAEGRTLGRLAQDGTAEQRTRAGELLTIAQFSSPVRAGLLHGDPHPGNFLLDDAGTLTIIDFGGAIDMPHGFPPVLTEMMRLALRDEGDRLLEVMRGAGYLNPRAEITPAEAERFLAPFTEPMRTPTFRFDRAWMQDVMQVYSDVSGDEFRTSRAFRLPSDYVLVHRVLSGSVGILCQLDVTAPYRELVGEWMPELFAD